MRLLICAGGTGGGVYPAIAVLKAISKEADAILWVGGKKGIEAGLVQREGMPFEAIPAAGVHGVGWRTLPGNILRLVQGTLASLRILRQFKPDVLFFTGGYVAVPMALAGWRTPSVLYVPDIEPGLALKVLSRFARVIAITADEARPFFSHKNLVVTGYPTRPELANWDKTSARAKLNLDPNLPTLLFFGGSLGARSINRAALHALPALLQQAQIVHITGNLDWDEVYNTRQALPSALADRYHIFAYLHDEMGAALASADLVVSRAGASTLGEFPLFGLPAILVPYPHAWRYQKVNAAYLESHGAAILMQDELMGEQLLPTLQDLLANPQKLAAMQEKMQSLRRADASSKIAEILKQAAGGAN